MSPYEVLGITSEADDAAIRNAYLTLVKRYPPERHPDKFREIHAAYEMLKDEDRRLRYYLFNQDPQVRSPFQALFEHFNADEKRKPPAFEEMKEYLRECAKQ